MECVDLMSHWTHNRSFLGILDT